MQLLSCANLFAIIFPGIMPGSFSLYRMNRHNGLRFGESVDPIAIGFYVQSDW